MQTAPDISAVRKTTSWVLNPMVVVGTAGFLAYFWLRSLAIEPFDFDESVYRQMAEEMKRAGGWLSQPLFNGEAYNHKPPFYISLLAGFSALSEGDSPQVGSFSSRTVSILFSVALAYLLHRTWNIVTGFRSVQRFEHRRTQEVRISPAFFLLMSFLPTIASSAILLDPMLVFFTSLFVCAEAVRISRQHEDKSSLWPARFFSILGMTGAVMTKGLIGLVLPAGSAILYLVLAQGIHWRSKPIDGLRQVFYCGIRDFLPTWIPALLLSTGYYFLLWNSGGKAFVEEFFIKHHFGRATSAFEGHSGSIFYYVPIFVLGAGYTLSWLSYVYVVGNSQRDHSNVSLSHLRKVQLWLISWSLFCFLFFSMLATKLPNYIWPIWPALALLGSVVGHNSNSMITAGAKKILRIFARWSAFILPAFFAVLGFSVVLWEPLLQNLIPLPSRDSAILNSVLQHKQVLVLGFLLSALFSGVGAVVLRRWGEFSCQRGRLSPLLTGGLARWLAFFQVSSCAVLMLTVVPVAEEVMTLSLQQSAQKAKRFMGVGEKLATADLYSPNVVSSHGEPVVLGIGESEWVFDAPTVSVILTPVWNVGVCERRGYDVADGAEFFRICLRSYRETLEGPKR